MQDRIACAKEQISELESRVNEISKNLTDNIKSAHIIRSQLGITEFNEHDQCKGLASYVGEQLASLRQALVAESSTQNKEFQKNEKEIQKLRIEKRTILDELKLLDSQLAINEESIGLYLDCNNNEFD